MPTICANDGTVTHIITFACRPEQQQALVDSLTETVAATEGVPGWLSASIHKGFGGTRVVNYVQFASHEAAQAVTRHLVAGGYIQRNVALGVVTPGQYEVVHTLSVTDAST